MLMFKDHVRERRGPPGSMLLLPDELAQPPEISANTGGGGLAIAIRGLYT
jgi:hypothetical protein